jgi:uncharacterized 2Fe-2S/4Fe-4S cluster protein (DUF4445 family)
LSGKKITVSIPERRIVIEAEQGETLLNTLIRAGLYVSAPCGAKGLCGKCAVKVTEGLLEASGSDLNFFPDDGISSGLRLSCTAYPTEDITVCLPSVDEFDFEAVSFFAESGSGVRSGGKKAISGKTGYAVALDIGTTTVAAALVDMSEGKVADSFAQANRQRKYGADVISRILSANSGFLPELSGIIRAQIPECINELCGRNGIDRAHISDIAITANTAMIHILLGLSCETLGVYPFKPVTLSHVIMGYEGIFEPGFSAKVHILPGISAFIGADIAVGIYLTELYKPGKPALLLDIGTNGEIALKNEDTVICAATAAGPAFEGGNISCGTGAVSGAVRAVKCVGGIFEAETIGNAPPVGVCGSGVVDIAAEMLRNGFIDGTGYLTETGRTSGLYRDDGIEIASGAGCPVVFSQKDVRELQLAKSAVRSGIDALLSCSGLGYDDIGAFYIAGGFGFSLNLENAALLGLVPSELIHKISLIGNSSLGGAVKYLTDTNAPEELSNIIRMTKEHSLPHDELFGRLYIENMSFNGINSKNHLI